MGYTIRIGEKQAETEDDYTFVYAEEASGGPVFPGDEFTGETNVRSPSYTGWDEFARAASLYGYFFDKTSGVMRDHPGFSLLTNSDLDTVRQALDKYKAKNPASTPETDYNLVRLLWLEYWIEWALANCKEPVITNS